MPRRACLQHRRAARPAAAAGCRQGAGKRLRGRSPGYRKAWTSVRLRVARDRNQPGPLPPRAALPRGARLSAEQRRCPEGIQADPGDPSPPNAVSLHTHPWIGAKAKQISRSVRCFLLAAQVQLAATKERSPRDAGASSAALDADPGDGLSSLLPWRPPRRVPLQGYDSTAIASHTPANLLEHERGT